MVQEQLYRDYVTKDGVMRFVCESRPDDVPEGITEVHVMEVETSEKSAGCYFKLRGLERDLQALCRDYVSTREEDVGKGLLPEMIMSFYTVNAMDDFTAAWEQGLVTSGPLSNEVKERGSLFMGLMRVRWVLQHMRMATVGSTIYFKGWDYVEAGYARLYGVSYVGGSLSLAAYERQAGVQALDLAQAPLPGDSFDFFDHRGCTGRMFHVADGVYASFTPEDSWRENWVEFNYPNTQFSKHTKLEGYVTFFQKGMNTPIFRLPVVPICDLEDMMYVHAYLSSIPGVTTGDADHFCSYVEEITGLDKQKTGGQSNV